MFAVELEISRENVVDHVVQIVPINEVASLVTGVHGNPAELIVRYVPFHVCPHWFALDGDRILVG